MKDKQKSIETDFSRLLGIGQMFLPCSLGQLINNLSVSTTQISHPCLSIHEIFLNKVGDITYFLFNFTWESGTLARD